MSKPSVEDRRSEADGEAKAVPVYTRRMRVGNAGAVEAAVWENDAGEGKRRRYNVSVSRSWQDEDGFKQSTSFWPVHLPSLALCVQDCARWIAEQDGKQ